VVFGLLSLRFFSYVSLSLAQTSPETIYQLDIFTQQKPCAQSCFTGYGGGCNWDALGGKLGCQYDECASNFGSPDRCFCRLDLQSIGQSYLTSCVKAACTLGQSSIDISSAGSIYNFYCSSKGFVTTESATPVPTTSAIAPATTTEITTATASSNSGSSSQEISTACKWILVLLALFHLRALLHKVGLYPHTLL